MEYCISYIAWELNYLRNSNYSHNIKLCFDQKAAVLVIFSYSYIIMCTCSSLWTCVDLRCPARNWSVFVHQNVCVLITLVVPVLIGYHFRKFDVGGVAPLA